MKDFIRKTLKRKLNEISFDPHFYERSEDRVWGKKPQGPASINAPAWAGDSVGNVDLIALDTLTRKLYKQTDIPITQQVKIILDSVNVLEDINFDTDKGVAVVLWKTKIVHTGKDQNPPGGTLLVIIRNNTALNVQWQPNKDVNIGGGKVTGIDYIVNFDELLNYVSETGSKTITTKDLNILRDRKMGKSEPKKEETPIFVVDGSKYILANKDGDLVNKNNPKKIIKFDDLPDDVQLQVLDSIS